VTGVCEMNKVDDSSVKTERQREEAVIRNRTNQAYSRVWALDEAMSEDMPEPDELTPKAIAMSLSTMVNCLFEVTTLFQDHLAVVDLEDGAGTQSNGADPETPPLRADSRRRAEVLAWLEERGNKMKTVDEQVANWASLEQLGVNTSPELRARKLAALEAIPDETAQMWFIPTSQEKASIRNQTNRAVARVQDLAKEMSDRMAKPDELTPGAIAWFLARIANCLCELTTLFQAHIAVVARDEGAPSQADGADPETPLIRADSKVTADVLAWLKPRGVKIPPEYREAFAADLDEIARSWFTTRRQKEAKIRNSTNQTYSFVKDLEKETYDLRMHSNKLTPGAIVDSLSGIANCLANVTTEFQDHLLVVDLDDSAIEAGA
jgi:hypothetical protein